MILIYKSKSVQRLILTLTETTTIDNPQYLMVLKNDANRDTYSFYLPDNESEAIERYDLFNINTNQFNEMPNGFYSYSVFQQNQGDLITDNLTTSVESGKLLIKGVKEEVEVISPIRSDSFLTY